MKIERRVRCVFLAFIMFALLQAGNTLWGDNFVDRYFKRGMEALAAGHLDDAEHNFLLVLERNDQYLDAIDCLTQIYKKKDDRDSAVYYLSLYVDVGSRLEGLSSEQSTRLREIKKDLNAEDPIKKKIDGFFQTYAERLILDAKVYQKRKLFQIALKIVREILKVYPGSKKAEQLLKKLQTRGSTEVAVVDFTGGVDPTRKKEPSWIKNKDRLHSAWKKAWEEKTQNYTIKTNAGYVVLQTTAVVMEQMHRFYQTVYRYPKRGGKTPRIFVKIFKNRKEFEDYAPEALREAAGYFAGNEIATFDVTGEGKPTRDLYSTLFHEASHQFLSYVSSGVPTWLNEGLATFFEACLILSNKQVLTNQLNSGRLMNLVAHLQGGAPYSLYDILTTPPGLENYTGTHYAYGWGVVYFFYNFEDDDGNFVYRDLLDEYLKSFKKGAPADQIKHFTQSFKLGQKEYPSSLEKLESQWKKFIFRIHQIYLGKLDLAAEYFSMAEDFLKGKEKEKAERYLRKVLDIKPNHSDALYHLGSLLDEKGEKDRALDFYSQFLFQAGPGEEKRKLEVTKRMEVLDPLAKSRMEAANRFKERMLAAAKEYRKGGLILRALDTAEKVFILFSRDGEASSFINDLEKESGKTTVRWRHVFNEQDLQGWYWGGENDAFRVEDGELIGDFQSIRDKDGFEVNYRLIFCDRDFESNFSFSVDLEEAKPTYIMGICFGVKSASEFRAIILRPPDQVHVNRFSGQWHIENFITLDMDQQIEGWSNLRIDISNGKLTLYLKGKKLFEKKYTEGELRGDLGLVIGNGKARFKNIRYLYRD